MNDEIDAEDIGLHEVQSIFKSVSNPNLVLSVKKIVIILHFSYNSHMTFHGICFFVT